MKNKKRDWVAVGFSVLLHIILLTGMGRLLPSDESAPLAMLEFELISTAQAAGHPFSALETSAPHSPPANAEPLKIKQPLIAEPEKKSVEKVNPPIVQNIPANIANTDDGVSVAQTAKTRAVQTQVPQTQAAQTQAAQTTGGGNNLGSGAGSSGSGGSSAKAAAGNSLKPPQLLHKVEPVYPESARRQNLEGKVVIRLEVAKNGSVAQAIVEQSSGQQALDSAVLAAVKKWRFIPAKDTTGAPMRSFTTVPVVFKLN